MITNLDRYKKAKLIALCNAGKGEINIDQFIKKINQLDQLMAQSSISKPDIVAPK